VEELAAHPAPPFTSDYCFCFWARLANQLTLTGPGILAIDDQFTYILLISSGRETGIEPATFSLGSGIGFKFSRTYPVEKHEPIETMLWNVTEIWTKSGPRFL